MSDRLEIRRLRQYAAREEPWATWRERHTWATEAVAYVRWRPWLRSLLLGAYARWLRWKAADRLTARAPASPVTETFEARTLRGLDAIEGEAAEMARSIVDRRGTERTGTR